MDHIPYIETFTGKQFHFLDPAVEEFDIIDISTALANQCRFTGHVKSFYSVAEHSVLCSTLVHEWGGTMQQQLQALLHDGTEAYLTDVASPVKPFLGDYKPMEKNIWSKLAVAFEVPAEFFPIVKRADLGALLIEAEHLMPSKGKEWSQYAEWAKEAGELPKLLPMCLSPRQARLVFLRRFDTITGSHIVDSLFIRQLDPQEVSNG